MSQPQSCSHWGAQGAIALISLCPEEDSNNSTERAHLPSRSAMATEGPPRLRAWPRLWFAGCGFVFVDNTKGEGPRVVGIGLAYGGTGFRHHSDARRGELPDLDGERRDEASPCSPAE